jgi:Family of unknown function (DUF6982)
MNRVVARFNDGRIVKGVTSDFVPAKERFHVSEASAAPGAKPLEIQTKDLKALFFVKDYAGNQQRGNRNEFDPAHPPSGRRIRVEFADGEVLVGTTQGYQPGRPGFFLVPANPGSNTERCYVVTASTKDVRFL